MKKHYVIIMTVLTAIIMTSCSSTKNKHSKNIANKNSTKTQTETATTNEKKQEQKVQNDRTEQAKKDSKLENSEQESTYKSIDENEAKDIVIHLVDENLYCMSTLFGNVSELIGEYDVSEEEKQVPIERFASYMDFENYLHNIYNNEVVNKYLHNYPYEGNPLYINKDGKLFVNLKLAEQQKGYYIQWENGYDINITKFNDTQITFDVTTTIKEPSDDGEEEQYGVNGTASLIEGKWVLNQIVY